MWACNKDTDDEPIWLLQPSTAAAAPEYPSHCSDPATTSFLGGTPSFYPNDDSAVMTDPSKRICSVCHNRLLLVLQMYAPMHDAGLDRSLYVFACNRDSCWKSLFTDKQRFHLGGQGVVQCVRSQQPVLLVTRTITASNTSNRINQKQQHCTDNHKDSELNSTDWTECPQEDTTSNLNIDKNNTDSLEHLIASLEVKADMSHHRTKQHTQSRTRKNKVQPSTTSSTNQSKSSSTNTVVDSSSVSFTQHFLETLEEPTVSKNTVSTHEKDHEEEEEEEEDDEHLGLSYTHSEDHVQRMISKYIEQEDDEELISSLQQKTTTTTRLEHKTIYDGDEGEADEPMDPEQRAFFAFLHRIRRVPSQAVRYAYGAKPLWSIPSPTRSHTPRNKKGQQGRDVASFPQVPKCICGADRCFEFQLMPSVLHVLQCDDHAHAMYPPTTTSSLPIHGGMNWGILAVYSCAHSCTQSREEFVVVQEPADG